jgi:predicted ester cyclase
MTKNAIKIYLILLSIIGLPCCTNNSKPDNTELNIEVVRKYHEIWSTGNVEELNEIIAPEFQSHFIGGFEYIGIEGAKNSVLDTKKAFPDWTENIIEIITQGDKVVTRYRSTGTHLDNWDGIEATGNKVVIDEMSVYHLKNGKIIEQWGFWDEIELKKQMTLNIIKN